nr:MAG TPA: crystallin beta/gamma motif-containing protein [Bacteriophage sp.]
MDPQKRAEIEQMMRRDVASGNIGVKIKMPGENNSDELNDITNFKPTSEYATYDTGRRDDAGNPIMSSDVMDLMMTKSYESQKESDWSVSNIADAVYTKLRDNFYDGSVQPVDFDNPYYTKDMTAPPEPITGKDLIKGAMPESFQASKLYADYFYGEDEKREQIKKAHDLTGIRAETIANDPDVWEKVMKIVQRAEKLKKLPGMVDANGDLNMSRVYEAMPYLREIVEKHGTNEAVMMLQNAEGLRTVGDAYNNEFMRFAGSVATGVERGWYNFRKQLTHANAMIHRRKLTDAEREWITYLEKQKEETPEYSYGGIGQAVGAMIGGAAENIPMLASSQGAGGTAGGITFAVTKSPTAAQWVYRIVSTAVMGLEIGGSQYEENLSKLDAKGRAMYTPTEAAALSATQGLAEGVIEQLALQKIARTIFGRGDAKALRDLYAGAGAKDLALAAEGATANEAARSLIKERILGAAKAGAITFNTELQEEFAQQVSDMVIENMAQMALKGDDAEIASVREILQKSTTAAIEAAPSIAGFGLLGFGGHVGAHTNTMLNARSHMEQLVKNRLYRSVNENQNLINTVEAVGDNLKNVQELQGKAPDLVNEMLDSQNRRYGIETTVVDIVSLNQEEGGAELVQEIAVANNISTEELQACADGTGMLPVKTSTLQQMTTNLDEGKRKALFQNITKSSDLYTDKQTQQEAKVIKEILGAFREKTEEEVGDSVDRYVESAFAEHEHRALARDILLADINHPAAEIKRRMNRLDSDLAELTAVQSDGGAESAEYLAHIQPEIDKINAQKEALSTVEGTIKGLQPGDVVATAELSPEARGVYHELAGQLGDAKSKKARTAARASALLAARYADRMAKVYSEVKGEPYTAADYMREHLRVDARADDKKREAAKKKAEVVKDFIDTHFPDAAEREMAVIATMQDAVSPAKGWRTLYKDFVAERDELLRPAMDALGRGMGNGVDIVPIDDDGRGIRVSNNEPWYQDFYKENGRAPRKSELMDLAYLLTVGDSSAPRVENWMPSSQEDVDAMQGAKAHLDELNSYIHTLENIKERMMQMDSEALNQDEAQTGVFGDREKAIAVREIRNLVPLEVVLTGKPLDKKAAEAVFSTFGEVENPRYGTYATFPKSMVGKIIKHRGLDVSQMLTDIPRLFSSSVLALVEPEYKKEGHKEHPNILAYHHYVNKFTADGTTYYIRFSLREEKTKNPAKPSAKRILHSTGISDIRIYEENKKDVSSQRIRVSDPGEESKTSFVDHRLAELFDFVKDIPTDENAETLEQSAWHGTQYDFREFLLEMIGAGEGRQAHGWGLYLSEKREAASSYGGKLYHVDIPDNDVLIDEQKTYDAQPAKVRKSLGKLVHGLTLEQLENWGDVRRLGKEKVVAEIMDTLSESDGMNIYGTISDLVDGQQEASELLNQYGIKGITYHDEQSGRGFVIFDDKAISIIEKFNQEHARETKGNITATYEGARRLISLMQSADQSTFMHEMAHNFLFDLEHIAEIAPESRYAKDLVAIQKWASWKKDAADEYAGAASAAEFRNREEKILAAEKKGDTAEVERLKREWMQERFARGFEEYLRNGEAPAQGLRAVFRRFKAWLTRIYKDVTGAGVRASAEVEAIMARMIATDEEIEAAAVVKRAQRLQKINPELLNADSAETMIQWETEAKERAKETLLKELIREMQGRDVDAHMEDYEAQLKAEMRENPVWQAEAVAETFGVGQVIASGYYPTAEAYEKALKDAGGGFDAAYNRQVREERERYKTEMPNAEAIAQRAEEVLASQEYTARQTALEGELLNEYIKAYDNAPQRLKDAMIGVARALEREEDAPLEKAVTALKYAFHWQEKQAKEIEDLRMLLSASKEAGEEDRTKMREKFGEAFNRLKLSAAQNLEAVRSLRDSAEGRVAAMRVYAQQHLENAPIHEATNTRHWMWQVQSAAKETERHLTNMLRKNNGIEKEDKGDKDLAAARTAKTRQLAMEAMTHESVKLKRELDRMVKYFARREKNLANDKTGKIDGNHRYFIHHLLYVFGLRRSDGVPLMGEGARSWSELMQEIKDSNDGFDGVDIPEWLTSAATSRDTQRKYTELSMQELRDLRMLVEYLYVTGRNKNTLLTSGENIDEVAARMYQNYEEHIGEQDGGKEAHAYMVQLLKPETMLKVIGGKSGAIVDYLYNTLFDAQEKKTEALEKNAKRLEVIIGQYYTQNERRKAWGKKIGIALTDGTELTKENVLSMALNWGNEGNRSRLVAGLSTKTPYTEKDVEEIFAKTMTKKDWAFVQEIWDYLNEHGDAVNEVVEKSAGTPMKRVAPDEFTIEASTGEELTIRGGYYPIRYDPKRSERAADQELATVAESVGGAMAFGSGMGSTKNRANGAPLGRPLDLSLDVMYRHIDQQIHIATMRLACRDVYKLMNHSAVKEPILQSLGKDAYDSLKRWVENTWQEPMNNNLYIETKAEEWRANTVTAIMAFRVSTALLNASNIMPMADRLGTANAIQAMLQYLRHPQRIRQFVLNDSAFMRNRAHNMDRDLNTKGKDIFGGKNSVRKCLIKYGTWLMEETDMLCSVPTYYWTYQERYNREVADGTDEIIARERAHREAHEAVRSIFGSADAIDRSAVQRSQSGLVKAFTPFFSFFNAQMNAVWEKYYAGRYDQHKKNFVERYSSFVRSYLFRFVAMAAIETMIRQSLEAVSAGSGDKKDKDEWYKKFLKQWAANSLGSVASGFPVINMVGEIAQGMITGKLQQGRNSGVVFAAVGRLTDPIQMAYSLQSDKSKIDAIDFGRALTKGIAGTMYAVPDTLTDGFWNTARFMKDNYRLNNPDDLREFIAKTILDKKLKQK